MGFFSTLKALIKFGALHFVAYMNGIYLIIFHSIEIISISFIKGLSESDKNKMSFIDNLNCNNVDLFALTEYENVDDIMYGDIDEDLNG